MDRSSMHRVETTQDVEKRIAFKAKLAQKIDSPKSQELPAADNTFNGVAPGGKLFHPSLGEGTLVEVDHANNEVLIDFASKGLIGLVLNQARSFIHAPTKVEEKGIAGKDDAFVGSEIQSRMLAPQDRAFREVDLSPVTSADFVIPEKKTIPTGSSVWHPDLGACTVFSVDAKANIITLDTPLNGRVDMVLTQVEAKLRPIDSVPEHVPVKPLVREALGKKFPEYTSRGDVSVSLPEAFNLWRRNQQHMFLTRTQHLTTEQANDVFAVLDGKKPMFHEVSISWQSQSETESNIIPGPEALSTKVDGINVYPSILREKNLWHPDFGECTVASVNGNQLILLTSIGQVPCVLDVTVPKLAPITPNSGVKHAAKELNTTRVLVTSDSPVEDRPKVNVTIPEVFVNWRAIEQYQYLTVSCRLSPEQAHDIIDSISGKLHSSKTEYEIQWTDEVPEAHKRVEFKQQLLERIDKANVEPVVLAPKPVEDLGIKRVVEEVVVTKKETVLKQVVVNLPQDFNNWTASGKYVFLTRTRQLTSNEANDVLDVLHGKPINSTIQYDIVWSE